MTVKRTVRILVIAGGVGIFFGVVLSGDEVISARVWLGAAAMTVIAILLRDLLAASSIERTRFVGAWSLKRTDSTSSGPRGLQNIHSLLVNAANNPRTYGIHVRPRLVELAHHYLPIRRGIDVEHDPHQVGDVLGDVAWLIDPAVQDRAPTAAEIERFLDVVLAEKDGTPQAASSHARLLMP